MVNYQNGKIYKIYSLSQDLVYVGSTTRTLAQRLSKHKGSWMSWKKGKRGYVCSFKIFEECDDYRIELIELCPCNSKMELQRCEGKWIRELECVNKKIAGRTKKEYYQDNKETSAERMAQYYQKNKIEIIAKSNKWYNENKKQHRAAAKKYYEANKEDARIYNMQYREKHKEKLKEKNKQYYEDNKTRIDQKNKEYREKNREKSKEYFKKRYQATKEARKVKITCECGSVIGKGSLSKHKISKKHLAFINNPVF